MDSTPSSYQNVILALLLRQHPHRQDIIRALQLCSTGKWSEDNTTLHFLTRTELFNQYAQKYLQETLLLETENAGPISLHILEGRIASINFFSTVNTISLRD